MAAVTTEENETELEIVKPIVKTKDAVNDMRAFEELKANLLSASDYQAISGRNFIKKSGWRKLALVFNISDQIIESSKAVRDEDGSFVWSFKVRASAPNGRFTEAVASCDSRERRFSHVEHDTFATAHTRAKSRAISDLIGAGEISAEEMDYDREGSLDSSLEANPTEGEKEKAMSLLHSANEIYSRGVEKNKHQQEQEASAQSEIESEAAVAPTAKFELNLGGEPFPVSEEESPFSRFFIGKICGTIKDANPRSSFELEKDERGRVTAVVWHNIGETQQREIANTLAWSMRKVAEKRKRHNQQQS
ncbi:MAG: hypothetical protein ACREBS_02955 [Nitrososphaerales archaeon]